MAESANSMNGLRSGRSSPPCEPVDNGSEREQIGQHRTFEIGSRNVDNRGHIARVPAVKPISLGRQKYQWLDETGRSLDFSKEREAQSFIWTVGRGHVHEQRKPGRFGLPFIVPCEAADPVEQAKLRSTTERRGNNPRSRQSWRPRIIY